MTLKGRRIIVTGGALGIGAAIVRAYVEAGAHVASLDVLDEAGAAVAGEAHRRGPGTAWFQRCDVGSRAEVEACVDAACSRFGGLDVLVNVAGVQRTAPTESLDDAHWDLTFAVNARGTMNTNQAVFPHLRERGGQILNFGSVAGVRGMPGAAAYAASKGAVLAWTRTAAVEWARHGITVNAVAPGMWTPMYEALRVKMTQGELVAHDAAMVGAVPLGGRLGDPDRDLAPVMVFLASEGARFITGQTLPIDGGLLILT